MLLPLLPLLLLAADSEATHHGCNATVEDPSVWECDFKIWPHMTQQMWWQNLTDYTTPIKKLRIFDIDLYIASEMFRNFSSYQVVDDSRTLNDYLTDGQTATGSGAITSSFNLSSIFVDQQSEPELELECQTYTGAYLALYNDSFVGLEWMKRITIKNCELVGFDTGAFKVFKNITSFRMLGGVWNDMAYTAMSGMSIYSSDVLNSGLLEITAKFPFNFVFFFMLDPLAGAKTVTIRGNDMNRVQTMLVSKFTSMGRLDMSYNEFYFLPETLFEGLDRLSSVDLYGIKWFCYCTGTWLC